jgi:hypothetical protein
MTIHEGWMTAGACVEVSGLPWLNDAADLTTVQRRTMRLVCLGCPVLALCRDYVVRTEVCGGFWAGDTRDEDETMDGAA